jgi:hypothetical protein
MMCFLNLFKSNGRQFSFVPACETFMFINKARNNKADNFFVVFMVVNLGG